MMSSPKSPPLPDPVEEKPKCKKRKKIREKENMSSQDCSSNPSTLAPTPPQVPVSKRTKSPGVRVVGGRIYDSERGKTCHQCRQKTMDFSAACKILRQDTKPCTLKFCHKCLLNRYGEKAEEVEQSDNWQCPKCRGICNCSFCMKKRGHQPTGILVHTAKATGFNSVSAMLLVNPTAEVDTSLEKILDVKQGQAEAVLQELTGGCSRRRGQYSSLVQLQIQLLSFIRKNIGVESPLSSTSSGNSWLQALEKCISESEHTLKDFPMGFFDRDGDGYEKLEPSKKLRLLNFLCDETLCTTNMRDWIDKQNLKLLKRQKVAKEKVLEAKDKERHAKQKMQDEVAKAVLSKNGAPLSISEHEGLVLHIKAEVAKAHAEKLEAMEMVPKKKQRSDAVRTEPVYLDGDDHIFWRLKGYSSEPNILLQDIRNLDSDKPEDKWFCYDVEQKSAIDKYISSVRKKRHVHVLPQGLDTLATLAVAMEEGCQS